MTELELNWTLSTPALLGVAAAAIALLLVLIIRFRVHAFLALIVVSLLTAVATGISAADIVPTLLSGFGTTLGSVALLVGLGAMLGRMLEVSGGAKEIDTLPVIDIAPRALTKLSASEEAEAAE